MLRVVPPARNEPENISERQTFCIEAARWSEDQILFFDEAGFSLWNVRSRGRNLLGQIATIEVGSNSRGNNVTLTAAISPEFGLLHSMRKAGPINTGELTIFLIELIKHPILQSKSFLIICDNVAFHKTEQIKDVFAGNLVHHTLAFLPTYSPQLNRVESLFSKVKWYVNTHEKSSQATLFKLIDDSLKSVTMENCQGWYRQTLQYYISCALI